MITTSKKRYVWVWLFALPLLLHFGSGVAFAQKQPAGASSPSVVWEIPAVGNASGYIGNDTNTSTGCLHCHKTLGEQFSKTAMAHTDVAGTNTDTSCETCHGPGKAHNDAEMEAERTDTKNPEAKKLIFRFDGSPQENSARCLTCHGTSPTHDKYDSSEHKLMGVSCQDCHASHLVGLSNPKDRVEPTLGQSKFFSAPEMTEQNRWLNQSMLRKAQPELCFDCHRTIQAAFALPNHHRVPEGLMKCTDCHNAHGTANRSLLTKTNWETCVGCHTEKRGPYVYEHASVKIEGCVICHNPHGTVNRLLLKTSETRFLCLSCHTEVQVNVPHGHLSYQTGGNCTRCHAVIHGSNLSPYFLR